MTGPARPLVLASTSPYRAGLLRRLRLPFTAAAPHVVETPRRGEDGASLARRLAEAKARALAGDHPLALIIGGDQVASVDGRLLGKPGHRDAAADQLRACAAREVVFHTAVCLLDARDGQAQHHTDVTRVGFRQLDDAQIDAYLAADEPFDCAGSFKAESLGVALFDHVRTEDPTALTGLPLIWLCAALARAGLPPLGA